jgi:L-galactose dehydrogenase
VRTALDAGINLFDTSPFYGDSEAVLGRALAGVPRESFLLATKVGRYGPDTFDFSAARIAQSIDSSLQRLGVETLDIVHCHDIEFVALSPIVDEAIPALEAAREAGKLRFTGCSGLPLSIFAAVLDRAHTDVILSYCHHSLNDDSLVDLLPYLQAKRTGVIGASPLAMGLLTDAGPPDWHPAPPSLKAACAQAARFCRERGASLSSLALAWSVQNRAIATTLVGMADEATVRANVAAATTPLDSALLADIRAILAPTHRVTWPSGRPENSGGTV